MNWKDRLGIVEEEILEENLYVFNKEIDEYFINLGFYIDKMDPRFIDGIYYERLILDVPILRFDGDWDHDGYGVQRIFMNSNEIYIERQTSYRSFDGSDYYKFEKEPTSIQEIEEVLEILVKGYGEF